jgi:phospholipid/cholesterol/gamma-HCH transport system substrate-binding protein
MSRKRTIEENIMVKKKHYFTVGLFVLIGIASGVFIIVWLSASQYLQKGKTYATYFDESVQGLQIDSNVKYRGVNIGIVDKIRVAPDYRLIEIIMKIDYAGNLDNTIAKLKTVGITGIVYVELDHRKTGDIDDSPKITFTPEYPVISSNPSDIKQIFSGIDSIIGQINQIDFKGISDQIKIAAKSINTFVSGDEMKRIIKNLDAMAASLDSAADKVNRIVSDGKIDDILDDTRESIKEAKIVIKKVKEEVNALNIAATSDKANRLIDTASRKTKLIAEDLQTTSENLRRASENLDEVLERLKSDPSDIIFSEPPAKKR